MPSSSIIVAGAGIFGLTSAWELAGRGWDVTVIEPASIPAQSAATTDVSKVIRMDYGRDDLYTVMGEAALTGWDRWNVRWTPPLYHQDGFLLLAPRMMAPGEYEYESFTLLERRGHPVRRLSAAARAGQFPAWPADRYPDGYFNERAGWAESANVLARVAREVRAAGVRVLEGAAFTGLLERGGQVIGVSTSDRRDLRGDVVLVAAGAWTPTVLPHLQSVMWATGQPVVHFDVGRDPRWRAPRFPVWAADISNTGWYGFPALDDGALKIGHHGTGRAVHPDEPRTVPAQDIARFREFLCDNLPELADAPVRTARLCLYCDTFDGDFWIDHDPDRPGLVVAAGDSGHGFKFAPILGGLIADVVERRDHPWARRFRWRRRERDKREAARSDA